MAQVLSVISLIAVAAAVRFMIRFHRADMAAMRVLIDRRMVGRAEWFAFLMAWLGMFVLCLGGIAVILFPILSAWMELKLDEQGIAITLLMSLYPGWFLSGYMLTALERAATWHFERERAIVEAKEVEALRVARQAGSDLSELRDRYWRLLDQHKSTFTDGGVPTGRRASDGNPVSLLPELYEDLLQQTDEEWRQRRG